MSLYNFEYMDDYKIEQNMQFYLNKMELKFKADQEKIQGLQDRLNRAAVKIQKAWKRSRVKKMFRAALLIQRCWKKYSRKMKERQKVL